MLFGESRRPASPSPLNCNSTAVDPGAGEGSAVDPGAGEGSAVDPGRRGGFSGGSGRRGGFSGGSGAPGRVQRGHIDSATAWPARRLTTEATLNLPSSATAIR